MAAYKLLIEKKELTNVSQDALKWFYKCVLKGKPGPFACETISDTCKAVVLKQSNTTQLSLVEKSEPNLEVKQCS